MPHAGDATQPAPGAGGLASVCHVRSAPAWRRSARCCPISGRSAIPAPGSASCSPWACCCGQGRHRLGAGDLWPHRRCAGAEGRRRGVLGDPGGAGDRLRPAARRLRRASASCATRCSPRCSSARCARRRAADLPPSARAESCASTSTGRPAALARAIERGTRGHPVGAAARGVQRGADDASSCCWSPRIIWHLFDWRFAAITFAAVVSYAGFTMSFADWRARIRRDDERHRQRRQHQGARQPAELRDGEVFRQRGARGARATTRRWRATSAPRCACRSSLNMLNIGQAFIIAAGLTLIMLLAARERARRHDDRRPVRAGEHLSDAALPAAGLPRHGLREIKQGLVDMEQMFRLLEVEPRDRRSAGCAALAAHLPMGRPARCGSRTCVSATGRTARS